MKKQLARAKRLVVPGTAGQVLRDVRVDEPRAAGLEVDVGVADIRFAFAQGFHFGAMEDQAGFKLVEQMIVVRGDAVLRDDLARGVPWPVYSSASRRSSLAWSQSFILPDDASNLGVRKSCPAWPARSQLPVIRLAY